VLDRSRLSSLEKASTYQFMGYAMNSENNEKGAIKWWTRAIKQDVLPISQQLQLEFNIGQLYMQLEDYESAIRSLRSWFRKVSEPDSPIKPNGDNYYKLAYCYLQVQSLTEAQRLAKARRPAEIAIKQSKKPKENWLRLLGSIYFAQKEYKRLAKTLEVLITLYPKAEYYTQLSGAYSESGEELKSLAVLQLAYMQGMMKKPSQVKHLAQTYLYHQIPYQAGQVLEKGIADGLLEEDEDILGLLGEAWLISRETEKAYAPLERSAALASDGSTYMRLGQAYLNKQKWAEADAAFGNALQKGGLKKAGITHLLRGLARMYQSKWQAARSSFAAAGKYSDQAKASGQYLKYLEQLKMQKEALASSGPKPQAVPEEEAKSGDDAVNS